MAGFVKKQARKVMLPAGVVGALALLLAWVISHLGAGVGSGSGPGSADAARTGQSAATQTAGPIQVVIRGDRYWVGDADRTIGQIVAVAGVGSGGGPAVKIVSGPDSRLGAERDLEKALDQAHLSWALEAEPVAGQ